MKGGGWKWTAGLALGIFLLNVVLNVNLFLPGEMPYRDSIEGGYASTARFFARHPNPWGWNPAVYLGLPAQFTYLPGLPYLTALLSWVLPGVEIPYLYRLVTAVLTCLGPATLFLFVMYFTKSRGWALAAALGYTVFSPCYLLAQQIHADRGLVQLPWRVQVLVKYGEGPHNAGLTLLPLALMAVWAAAVGRKYWQLLLAAVSMAVIVLIGWVGALTLAVCCLLLLLTWAGSGKSTGFRAWRILAAGALAYLLACFWLTPSLIRNTAFNWPLDAFNYKLRQQQVWQLLALGAGILLLRTVFTRFPRQKYVCFLTLCLFSFGFPVLMFYWYKTNTIPESRRYAPELEMFLILVVFELFRLGLHHRWRLVKVGAVAVFLLLAWAGRREAWRYVTKDNQRWRPIPAEQTVEYQVGRWLAARKPAGRVLVSGGTRFRINSWFHLHQVGGTFDASLPQSTRTALHSVYQIRTGLGSTPGEEGQDALLQLKSMGAEYIAVHGPRSREHWRDFKNPRKFEGLLEAVYRDGDDVIYKVPFISLAHLVRRNELPAHLGLPGHMSHLLRYVAAIDDPARPKLQAAWRGSSELVIEGPIPEGMLVSVQVNHHPAWVVLQGARRIALEKDLNGFMVLHAEASPQARITMLYEGTREQRVMAAISVLAWLGALGGLLLGRRASRGGSDATTGTG